MKTYKVPNLNSKTPQAEQGKLINALKGVAGVESAILHPTSSEFEIKGRGQEVPKLEEIAAAASKAGFSLESSAVTSA